MAMVQQRKMRWGVDSLNGDWVLVHMWCWVLVMDLVVDLLVDGLNVVDWLDMVVMDKEWLLLVDWLVLDNWVSAVRVADNLVGGDVSQTVVEDVSGVATWGSECDSHEGQEDSLYRETHYFVHNSCKIYNK